MIRIPDDIYQHIIADTEQSYPNEACGLLGGYKDDKDNFHVTSYRTSPNIAGGTRQDRFEIDPGVRFKFMRDLGIISNPRTADHGAETIIGHYHSHPDHPAKPSATDLEMAYEPEFVWIIVSVMAGKAASITAHKLIQQPSNAELYEFKEIQLLSPDGTPYAALKPIQPET